MLRKHFQFFKIANLKFDVYGCVLITSMRSSYIDILIKILFSTKKYDILKLKIRLFSLKIAYMRGRWSKTSHIKNFGVFFIIA